MLNKPDRAIQQMAIVSFSASMAVFSALLDATKPSIFSLPTGFTGPVQLFLTGSYLSHYHLLYFNAARDSSTMTVFFV
jgi:hypothetical protein